jgi:limonene-1,2-epoxide hydrolase
MTTATTHNGTAMTANARVVVEFLEALAADDTDRAMGLLSEDAVWINVSLPAVRGRRQIERLVRLGSERFGARFRVHFHNVAANGAVVLTERTDEIGIGRVEQRFWVHGRFEVHDGRIVMWRDAFDWLDYSISLLRGVAGAISPRLNRRWPGALDRRG